MSDPLTQNKIQTNRQLVTRILVIDDQKVVRARIEEILSFQQDLDLVGTADDGDRAIALIESLKPDLILIDLEMPKMNGIEAIAIIRERFPELKILVLSTHERSEYIQQAIGAGADGYVLKHTPAQDLVAAVEVVRRGGSYLTAGLLQKIQPGDRQSSKIELQNSPPRPKNPHDACQLFHQPTQLPQPKSEQEPPATSLSTQKLPALVTARTEEFLPSIEKWMTWGGMMVMLTIVAILPLSSILKYKTKVKASATIRPAGEARLVQAKTEGQISEIKFKPGDLVERGEAIATIDRFQVQTRKNQLEKAISQQKLQLAQLDSQMSTIERQIVADTARNNSEIQAAKAELDGNRRRYEESNIEADSQVKEAQAQLNAAEATLSASENKLTRYSSAAAEGALSKEQLAEAELEVKQQRQEIEAAKARLESATAALNPSNSEVTMAQERIQQAEKSGLASIASLNREKEAVLQQRLEVEKQMAQDEEELRQMVQELKQSEIVATATGIISQLELRNPGQSVQMGQEIAQIIPQDGTLEIKTVVSPQDIEKLEPEQKVQVRVSACPYPDYGVLNAKVSQIAQDVRQSDSQQQAGDRNQANAAFYEVFAVPEASTFGSEEHQCALKPGMEGSAEMITREETVLQFILRKARLITNV